MNEYRIGNAIVKVYRPELSDYERKKREDRLKRGLEQFGKAMVDAGLAAKKEEEAW